MAYTREGAVYNLIDLTASDSEENYREAVDDWLPEHGQANPDEAADTTDEDSDQEYGIGRDSQEARDLDTALAISGEEAVFTVDVCLQRVLELFPDVSHDHVIALYEEHQANNGYETLPGAAGLDNIVEKLLQSAYPKQPKSNLELKRKRADSGGQSDTALLQRWEREDRESAPHRTNGPIRSMLKSEFPTWTQNDIAAVFKEKKHYFQSHVHIAGLLDTEQHVRRGKPSTQFADALTIAINSGWPSLTDELEAARKRVTLDRKQRLEEATKKTMEDENLQRAIAAGQTADCQACFDTLPMNRQIHCNGAIAHFTCYECMEMYIKSEVGDSRCRVLCTAADCGAGFDPCQLNFLADKKLLERLAVLQQEKDIRDAGLDDLEECPCCDYKVILPPIEEDFELRCDNPECLKISCRRCKALSHIPISCEQHAIDNKVNSRHKIEEAMTAAMVRNCNKCKKGFIKEYGCNKMTCPSCHHLQCYVCSASLTGYEHFDQGLYPGSARKSATTSKKCPLYDDVDARHALEVKTAEAAARAAIVAENPDVTAEDLEIKMSDAVEKADAAKRPRAGMGDPFAGLYPFDGGGDLFGRGEPPGRADAFAALAGGDALAGFDFDAFLAGDEAPVLDFGAPLGLDRLRGLRGLAQVEARYGGVGNQDRGENPDVNHRGAVRRTAERVRRQNRMDRALHDGIAQQAGVNDATLMSDRDPVGDFGLRHRPVHRPDAGIGNPRVPDPNGVSLRAAVPAVGQAGFQDYLTPYNYLLAGQARGIPVQPQQLPGEIPLRAAPMSHLPARDHPFTALPRGMLQEQPRPNEMLLGTARSVRPQLPDLPPHPGDQLFGGRPYTMARDDQLAGHWLAQERPDRNLATLRIQANKIAVQGQLRATQRQQAERLRALQDEGQRTAQRQQTERPHALQGELQQPPPPHRPMTQPEAFQQLNPLSINANPHLDPQPRPQQPDQRPGGWF